MSEATIVFRILKGFRKFFGGRANFANRLGQGQKPNNFALLGIYALSATA
jgi:hypothetical protein